MGFFSGVSKVASGLSGLAGGAKQSQAVPGAGFYTMPTQYQDLFTTLAKNANTLYSDTGASTAAFTPMGINPGEQAALDKIYAGFTPTQESINADMSMLMNPFDEYVINDINREAMGQNSLVNQAATMAGQQGSNRSFLGTSDVEQNRLNQIGKFRQGQYNTALDSILNNLTAGRRADALGAMGAGDFERQLDLQTRQAPYAALASGTGILGAFPTNFGSNYQGGTATSGSSAGSTFGKIAQGAQLAGTIAGLFSDRRLKENIELVGEENGFPIYKFNYINIPEKTYIGVMAQDVKDIMPEAVTETEGFMKVNYSMIGVKMREAA